jgi:hypothetical protein
VSEKQTTAPAMNSGPRVRRFTPGMALDGALSGLAGYCALTAVGCGATGCTSAATGSPRSGACMRLGSG